MIMGWVGGIVHQYLGWELSNEFQLYQRPQLLLRVVLILWGIPNNLCIIFQRLGRYLLNTLIGQSNDRNKHNQ